jgi:hypothetical protein
MLKFNKEITELEALLSTEELWTFLKLTFNSLDESLWITKNKKKEILKALNLKAFSNLVVRQSS